MITGSFFAAKWRSSIIPYQCRDGVMQRDPGGGPAQLAFAISFEALIEVKLWLLRLVRAGQ